MFKKIGILLITATLLLSCTGCTSRRKQEVATDTDATAKREFSSMDELEDNHFYIYRNKKYYPVYINNASFVVDVENSNINTTQNDNRTVYFNDDWDYIPTMYEGDALIYYTSENLNERFIFERFEDFGYSVGLSNLERLESGRYAFDATEEEDDNSVNPYINPESEANKLYKLNQSQIIIDNIGGAQLRSGNISRGGVIIGLEKDKLYSTDVYAGSKLTNYILKADTRMLTSMEVYSITNYSFLRSKILQVNIPDYFNSGYYMINGQGIFRYVKGTSYTEKTDFNIPNEVPEENEEEVLGEEKEINESNNVKKENFTINEEADVVITFEFGENESNYELADPVVKVIGTDSAYTLSEDDKNTQILKTHLKAGQYTLEITGLNGRTYEYKVVKE